VKEGIIQPGRRPQNRFFLWTDQRMAHSRYVCRENAAA
jgi:hypothetical protein